MHIPIFYIFKKSTEQIFIDAETLLIQYLFQGGKEASIEWAAPDMPNLQPDSDDVGTGWGFLSQFCPIFTQFCLKITPQHPWAVLLISHR